MATARNNPKLADGFIQEAETEQDEAPLPDQSDYVPPWLELDRIKAEYDSNAEEIIFQVFRQGPGGIKDLSFIKSIAQDIFSYELLQSPPFNGGKFRVYIRKQGVMGIRRNFLIDVEPGVNAVLPGQPSPASQDGAIASMIAAMSAGFTTLSQQIARTQAAPANTQMDTIALITALKPLIVPPPAATPERDPLEMLSRMLEIQNKISPPRSGDGETGANDIIIEAMRTFGKPMAEAMANAKIAPPVPNSTPGDTVTVESPTALPRPAIEAQDIQSSEEQVTMNELQMKIAVFKAPLILMARNNADPYPYACMVLDMFDDAQIAAYIAGDDWWTQLQVILPEAAPYSEWFGKLRDQTLALLKDDENTDTLA